MLLYLHSAVKAQLCCLPGLVLPSIGEQRLRAVGLLQSNETCSGSAWLLARKAGQRWVLLFTVHSCGGFCRTCLALGAETGLGYGSGWVYWLSSRKEAVVWLFSWQQGREEVRGEGSGGKACRLLKLKVLKVSEVTSGREVRAAN